MKYTFSFIVLLSAASLLAQEPVPAEPPKAKERLELVDLKVGFNAIRAGRTWFGTGKDTQELQLLLAVNQWNLGIDYGVETSSFQDSSYAYENSGNYYRFGLDRNFIKNRESGNVLSLGLRYARAKFEDQLFYTLDNGYGEQDIDVSNPTLNARWIELIVNLRGRIVSNLYMGFTLRWQFSRQVNGEGQLLTYEIPGFGTTARQNSTAFDYYLAWRIPFGKK